MSSPHHPCKQKMDKKVTHKYIRPGESCDAPSHSDILVEAAGLPHNPYGETYTLEETADLPQNSYGETYTLVETSDLPQNSNGETCEWILPASTEDGSSRGLSFVEPPMYVTNCNSGISTETMIPNTSTCSKSSTITVVKDPIESEILSSLRGTKDTVNMLASRVSELTYAFKAQFIPMQSMVMRTGKDSIEGCSINYKNVQNNVDGSAGSLQENLLSEKTMALAIIADIVDNQKKQRNITVSSSSEFATPTRDRENIVMKNAQATLKTSNVKSVIWPHTLVNEDFDELVSADNIFISNFLIGFCKTLALKPEETKWRLKLLHATALVYESLFSWSEARAFHNAVLINIEKGLINWTTNFPALSNEFLRKKLREEIKHGNKGTETCKGKVVIPINKHMDKKQGDSSKINAEIKRQGHTSQTQALKRQQYNDKMIVKNEYTEDSSNEDEIVENEYSEDSPNEDETLLDNCHPEIHTCAICSIGFILKDDLIIHMQIHTDKQDHITSMPKNDSSSERVRKSPVNISAETKTEIAKDCIKLGVIETKQKWSQIIGFSISKATLYKWRTKYLKQTQDNDNIVHIHTCPICLISFSKKNDVTIHMKAHTGEQDSINSVPQKDCNSGKVVKKQLNLTAGLRNKIAKDCILLGPTKAKLKWSQLLGHSILESNIGNLKKEYLKQNKGKFRKIKNGRPRVYNNRINNEIKAEIAKDCMKLGNAQARLKWSQQLGYSIPVSSMHFCKVTYMKQSQNNKLVDNKQCHIGKVQGIEHKLHNDGIIVATEDSRDITATEDSSDNVTNTGENDLRPVPPCDANEPITYTLVPNGSQQGKDTLIDSLGFRYVRKSDKKLPHLVTWVCTVRRKYFICNGRVLPRKGMYLRKGIHTCKTNFKNQVKNESGSLISLFDDKKDDNLSTYFKPAIEESTVL